MNYKIDHLPCAWEQYNRLYKPTRWERIKGAKYNIFYWFIIRWERFKDLFR